MHCLLKQQSAQMPELKVELEAIDCSTNTNAKSLNGQTALTEELLLAMLQMPTW